MRPLLITVIATVALLLTSCSRGPEGAPLEEDPHLSAQIEELRRTGGTRQLRELAPGNWDAVYVVRDPVTRDRVEQQIGRSIDMPELFTYGNILVFMKDGAVYRAVKITPVQIDPRISLVVKYSSAVRLIAVRPIRSRPTPPSRGGGSRRPVRPAAKPVVRRMREWPLGAAWERH